MKRTTNRLVLSASRTHCSSSSSFYSFSSAIPRTSLGSTSSTASISTPLFRRSAANYSQSGNKDPNSPLSTNAKIALGLGLILTPLTVWAYTRYEKDNMSPPGTSGAPGEIMSLKTTALDAGANMMQRKDPINAIHAHLCGVHAYCGNPKRQVIAHHYCSHLNEDVRQCLIYDSDQKDARLIGVEYVITPRLFEALDAEERKYWHSHAYEVKSGNLVAPGIPMTVEHKLMEDLAPTYGKTFHFWQVDKDDPLPLGPPMLMMSTSEEFPMREDLMAKRDRLLSVSTGVTKRNREDIKVPPIMQGADHWRTSKAHQLYLGEIQK